MNALCKHVFLHSTHIFWRTPQIINQFKFSGMFEKKHPVIFRFRSEFFCFLTQKPAQFTGFH